MTRSKMNTLVGMLLLQTWVICGQAMAADDMAILTPLVNDQTVAVLSIDLAQPPPMAGQQPQRNPMIDDLLKGEPQWVISTLDKSQEWNDRLWAAGCRRVYIVATLAYLPALSLKHLEKLSITYDPRGYWPRSAFVVLPGVEGREIDKLRTIAESIGATAPSDDTWHSLTCREVKGVAVVGVGEVLERLEKDQATSRPEFKAAFDASGDWPLRIVAVPPPIFGKAAEQMLPEPFPGMEASLGRVLSRGALWISLAQDVRSADEPYRLIIQSASAEDARNLLDLIRTGAVAAWLASAKAPSLDAAAAINLQMPKVEGDRLVLAYDRKRGDEAWRLIERQISQASAVKARSQSADQMKQIGLTMHAFHDFYKHFPDPAIRSKDGKPLLSWRVAILPFVEEGSLYKEFHLDESWDSEHNRKLIERMPRLYRNPDSAHLHPGRTRYLTPVGESLAFTAGEPHAAKDFTDGTSHTILLVEADADHAAVWTKPEDIEIDLDNPASGLKSDTGSFLATFADGSVRTIRDSVDPKVLKATFTRNGGELEDASKY